MEEVIVKATSQEEILHILEAFTLCLQSLATGTVNKTEIAWKLFNYGVVFKLDVDNVPVAFAGFYCNDSVTKHAFLSLIAVLPEYERKGYGRKILHQVISYSTSKGMTAITLKVRKNNDNAIAFYQQQGFVIEDKQTQTAYYMKKNI